jgi:hypothetical protein
VIVTVCTWWLPVRRSCETDMDGGIRGGVGPGRRWVGRRPTERRRGTWERRVSMPTSSSGLIRALTAVGLQADQRARTLSVLLLFNAVQ